MSRDIAEKTYYNEARKSLGYAKDGFSLAIKKVADGIKEMKVIKHRHIIVIYTNILI